MIDYDDYDGDEGYTEPVCCKKCSRRYRPDPSDCDDECVFCGTVCWEHDKYGCKTFKEIG